MHKRSRKRHRRENTSTINDTYHPGYGHPIQSIHGTSTDSRLLQKRRPVSKSRSQLMLDRAHMLPGFNGRILTIKQENYLAVTHNVIDFSLTNLAYIGAKVVAEDREVILIRQNSVELQDLYENIKEKIITHSDLASKLKALITILDTNTEKQAIHSVINTWPDAKQYEVKLTDNSTGYLIPLEFFWKKQICCRHLTLFLAYFISKMKKDKLINVSKIQLRRETFDKKNNAHAWLELFQENKLFCLIDISELSKQKIFYPTQTNNNNSPILQFYPEEFKENLSSTSLTKNGYMTDSDTDSMETLSVHTDSDDEFEENEIETEETLLEYSSDECSYDNRR